MCGINGIIQRNRKLSADETNSILNKMQEGLIHRGPDGEGTFTSEKVSFGMRRLSINGIETGNQPLYNEDRSIALVANGEIYNYIELNEYLRGKGHAIRTGSDCESIIHLYEEFGISAIGHLRGMFAFCLYDLKKQEVYIVRDRLGEKPLYYYLDSDIVIFSSELKSILSSKRIENEIDYEAIFRYFYFQFVPEPFTPFKKVKKLKPGHYIKINLETNAVTEDCYWSISSIQTISGDPIELIRDELDSISKIIFRSEVPVGIALSGGLDSSIVAALASRQNLNNLKAITIGYEGSHESDERQDAIEFARFLGIPIETVELSCKDFVDNFSKMNFYRDDPIADISGFGYYSLNLTAKNLGLKVLVQGQGGDELFWGYPWVRDSAEINDSRQSYNSLFKIFTRNLGNTLPKDYIEFKKWIKSVFRIRGVALGTWKDWKALQHTSFYQNSPDFAWMMQNSPKLNSKVFPVKKWEENLLATFDITKNDSNFGCLITRLIMESYLLENGMTQGDRLSMGNGIEMRLPFVDYRLVEIVLGLRKNPKNKLDFNNPPKLWLKDATKDLIPDFVRNRKKRGFAPPVSLWHQELFKKFGESLIDGPLQELNIFTKEELLSLSKGPFPPGTIAPLSFKALVLSNWLENFQ